jgi:hypothetical protein
VTDGMNFGFVFYDAVIFGQQYRYYVLNGDNMVKYFTGHLYFLAIVRLMGQDSSGHADASDQTLGQDKIILHVKKLIFDR